MDINDVTSIFLLSDGSDDEKGKKVKDRLNSSADKNLGNYTIHSFGFGDFHDEDLMTYIC